jgi:cyclopropane fatty-acyl-phospholipid synthase-like methyltransferase
MSKVGEHYDRLLAEHYVWMLGGDLAAVADGQAKCLRGLGVRPQQSGSTALDLGSGPGPQSLALAAMGFDVIAVDTSRGLLDELEDAKGDLPIRTVESDLCSYIEQCASSSVEVVVCMGDTLTHLGSKTEVTGLIAGVARVLIPRGRLVLGYRDLTPTAEGDQRFFMVRGSEDAVMTCFVEYVSDDTVEVHDMITSRGDQGWDLRISSYPKLRLGVEWLIEQCRAEGFQLVQCGQDERGMALVVAQLP